MKVYALNEEIRDCPIRTIGVFSNSENRMKYYNWIKSIKPNIYVNYYFLEFDIDGLIEEMPKTTLKEG